MMLYIDLDNWFGLSFVFYYILSLILIRFSILIDLYGLKRILFPIVYASKQIYLEKASFI